MTSIYKSSSHGMIPLSMEAKGLMQQLRVAITDGIRRGSYYNGGPSPYRFSNAPASDIAEARGELAQYISKLEANQKPKDNIYRSFERRPVPPASADTVDWNATIKACDNVSEVGLECLRNGGHDGPHRRGIFAWYSKSDPGVRVATSCDIFGHWFSADSIFGHSFSACRVLSAVYRCNVCGATERRPFGA